jgi:serine kinase of HPr protein (carbohydrate metabolism regulator)
MTDAIPLRLHATTVSINGVAVLIMGQSGTGKSDLALRLIDRGAVLVADDGTELVDCKGQLIADAPATISGRMEVRGLGIVSIPAAGPTPVALVVDLDLVPERFPLDRETVEIAGVTLPVLALAALEPSAPIKVELALRRLREPMA